jgi:hypothetical protein
MLRSIMMLISILAVTLNGAPASASPPPRLVQAEVDGVHLFEREFDNDAEGPT